MVHLVAYIYMLTSNEEMSKIEKMYLQRHRQVFLVPVFDKGLVLPDKLTCISKTSVKCLGVALGYANAQPLGLR